MFNGLKYAKRLEEVGVTREQAEMHMQILADTIEGNLATKEDIKDIRRDILELKTEIQSQIQNQATLIENKTTQLEQRMTIKMGTIVTIVIATLATLYQVFLALTYPR